MTGCVISPWSLVPGAPLGQSGRRCRGAVCPYEGKGQGTSDLFTGIIEALGTARRVAVDGAGRTLTIAEPAVAIGLTVGDSVAVNGACLTVTACDAETFQFQAGPETLQRTNLGELAAGDRVNLERSLRLGDRLDGHLVQGHVDGLGRVAERHPQGEWELVWLQCPEHLAAQMVSKGSVAVDGISLTLVDVAADRFSVALIPHTLQHTTLGFKRPGAAVNLETDILGKYVWKYLERLPRDRA
jgi:riboflavin synthase